MNPLVQKLQDRIQLLDNIQADDKGHWGVMTPQNMIEHLGGLFHGSANGTGMTLMLPPEQAAKMKARFFGAYYPFPRNVKMPGEQESPATAPSLRYTSFEEAKEKCKAAVENFLTQHKTNPTQTTMHGYFGDLTMEEWVPFHLKHVEHHLMQFGALPAADEKINELEKLLYKASSQVTVDTPAKWGTLNAQQMIEHLGLIFLLSTGRFGLKYKGTPEDAQRYWDSFQASGAPWRNVFPQTSFGKAKPPRNETMEGSKAQLQQTFQNYLAYCEANPDSVNAHSFLGNLTIDQWRQVHIKHLQHHLMQFGILEEVA